MPKQLKEKPRNAGTLTEAAFFSKITSVLRHGFMYWKPMMVALENASRPYKGPNKRLKKEYQCAHCKHWFKRADTHIDHIIECGHLRKWDDIVPFMQRLTSEDISNYQVLCKPCHLIKSKETREINKILNT